MAVAFPGENEEKPDKQGGGNGKGSGQDKGGPKNTLYPPTVFYLNRDTIRDRPDGPECIVVNPRTCPLTWQTLNTTAPVETEPAEHIVRPFNPNAMSLQDTGWLPSDRFTLKGDTVFIRVWGDAAGVSVPTFEARLYELWDSGVFIQLAEAPFELVPGTGSSSLGQLVGAQWTATFPATMSGSLGAHLALVIWPGESDEATALTVKYDAASMPSCLAINLPNC